MSQNSFQILNTQNFNYGTLPLTPVAEQNQTYFAYFDGVGGTGPEYIDGTGYFIKYLIDTEGNVVNPEPFNVADSPQAASLYNLLDNFEVGKNATVKLIEPNPIYDDIPNAEILQGTHRIAHVGRIVPIVVSETGEKKNSYTQNLGFSYNPLQTSTGDTASIMFGRWGKSNYDEAPTVDEGIAQWSRNISIYPNTASWNFTGFAIPQNLFIPLSSSADASTRLKFQFSTLTKPQNTVGTETTWYNSNELTIQLRKNNLPLFSQTFTTPQYLPWDWANYFDNPEDYVENYQYPITFTTPFYNYDANDEFTIHYWRESSGSTIQLWNSTLSALQETSPGVLIDGFNVLYTPYFTHCFNYLNSVIYTPGSPNVIENIQAPFNYSYLVLNPSSSLFFQDNFYQTLDPLSFQMGFSIPNIPIKDIKPGDFIRFEYDKSQIYTITEVGDWTPPPSFGSTDPVFSFKVVPNISPIFGLDSASLQLNHFVIYRVVNDGTYVTLDIKKDAPGGAYSGILQPEYVSKELIQKYDKIIQNLTEKEIIQ